VSLANDPATVRQAQHGGSSGVMRTTWRDPEDTSPNAARTARESSGWRSYCPLRKLVRQDGTSITAEHIHAADLLRQQADLARFGYMHEQTGLPVTDQNGDPGQRHCQRLVH